MMCLLGVIKTTLSNDLGLRARYVVEYAIIVRIGPHLIFWFEVDSSIEHIFQLFLIKGLSQNSRKFIFHQLLVY